MKKYFVTFSLFLVCALAVLLLMRPADNVTEQHVDDKAIEAASGSTPAPEAKPEAKPAPKPAQEAVLIKKGELNTNAKAKLLKNLAGDYYMGNQYAPVLMIEYASLSCPHCAHFHEAVLEDLIPTYVNTNKVRYIYRDFPLNAPALDASKLALCADKKNYFNFIKILFKSQENWVMADDYKAVLRNIGKLGGISDEQFDACLVDKKVEEKILETKKQAIEVLGVESTPTIFINGLVYKGPHTYEAVSEYINSLLKGAKQ